MIARVQERFPIKGPKFKAIAEHFKNLAIAESIASIDGHELGARIRNRALSCLEEAVRDNQNDTAPVECAMMITAQPNKDPGLPQDLGRRVTPHVEQSPCTNESRTEQRSKPPLFHESRRSHSSDAGTLSTEVSTAQTDNAPVPVGSMNVNSYLPIPQSYETQTFSSHSGQSMADNQALCASDPLSPLFSSNHFLDCSEFPLFDFPGANLVNSSRAD